MFVTYRKSSYSEAGNCTEVGAWFKSSYSMADGNCLEAGQGTAVIGVRDTRDNGAGPVLEFAPAAWTAFLQGLK